MTRRLGTTHRKPRAHRPRGIGPSGGGGPNTHGRRPGRHKPPGGAGHGTGIAPGGGGGPTAPLAQTPAANENSPYQTSNGAYLWLEQHYHPPKTTPTKHTTPPNTPPATIPGHHVHVHDPIHRVKVIVQHPLATLPFNGLIGRSSSTPHAHHHSSIASQEAHR